MIALALSILLATALSLSVIRPLRALHSANIAGISAAARVTTEGVEDTRTASRELHGLVRQFRV
ncbi:hypothetical protein [Dactylosporangium sp. NPDC049140]|uniref:hypothetical protein n=1 Tax=Dactylosporangium sp. NPDC049140 TaxID=3155647 RepID=UPI0033E2DA26